MENAGRRRLVNYVIDKRALGRLSLPFIIMIFLSIALVVVIRWQVMEALHKVELVGIENLGAMNELLKVQSAITIIGTIGIVIFAIICLGLWIIYSHRIFGPTVAIRRHVECLSKGDYSSRIHLRNTDEFRELSAELNHLAEILAAGD